MVRGQFYAGQFSSGAIIRRTIIQEAMIQEAVFLEPYKMYLHHAVFVFDVNVYHKFFYLPLAVVNRVFNYMFACIM